MQNELTSRPFLLKLYRGFLQNILKISIADKYFMQCIITEARMATELQGNKMNKSILRSVKNKLGGREILKIELKDLPSGL